MEPRSVPFKLLGKVDGVISKIEVFILSWGVIAMAVNTIANVFGRYVFHQSIYFSEELNEFLIVIITFMGLGYATRKGIHIRMSAIYDALPQKLRKILMILITITTAAMMATLTWYAVEYVAKVASRGRVTPALQVPLYLTYIWVVIGLGLATLQYLLTALRNLNLSEEEIYVSYLEVDSYEDPETAAAVARFVEKEEETAK
ncbi:2,3-diketo-L-gulonate TRAP transporter small permease protein YiaM [Pseudovibrio sp. W64]|uniref:TRAP transporter small permease protein n=1 Tax=Pseudovibrio ascidiaceicola TaxID=285279 RepID=A0A1I4ED18_9HYPH|nr:MULTISPECIES: TRAP transporter small permease [Pseudovibrio]KZK78743.1 2,3-diketo-L-gulonate TRAP transporter small permease protein YiaM [Pseudovibrio sp. W64]KZL23568.1 2,3-diketo-L-gulonate TRAP transporter small permease protein YiaM [Pseudovibrio sp. Ad37]KZL27627.1 2,3-diketo-L-gulonate TRAP transporter small permease protein YiaM [Pseudovibrio sp. WM33]SFL02477.1 TRAP-type C4-dicarboxylate transport system, small permease component [Pseudovibrio ascidiaceicola]